MKTMSDYTLYCNTIQTRKAIELGAPIEAMSLMESPNSWTGKAYIIEGNICALPPTTEQMIGWLEKKGLVLHIYPIYRSNDYCIGYKFSCEEIERNMYSDIFSTRPEATLAAIDAALEYLEHQKV